MRAILSIFSKNYEEIILSKLEEEEEEGENKKVEV